MSFLGLPKSSAVPLNVNMKRQDDPDDLDTFDGDDLNDDYEMGDEELEQLRQMHDGDPFPMTHTVEEETGLTFYYILIIFRSIL